MRRREAHEGEEVIGVRIGILVYIIGAALAVPGSGVAASQTHSVLPSDIAVTSGSQRLGVLRDAGSTQPSTRPSRCPYARLGVAFYRGRYVHWQLQRGASIPTWRKPRNCADARYLVNVWSKRSFASRKSLERWRIQQRTLRNHNTWLEAVKEAQKAYPGTRDWLLSCSSSEGAWGAWVPNREGSGVGGWMQMYPSTYSTMMHGYYLPAHGRSYEGAWKDLKRRGFIVPAAVDSWYNPLGQALASAYGKLNGRGGEWHGSGC